MPRYFFNTADGQADTDTEGTELPDTAVARTEAIRYAGALLRDSPDMLWDGRDFRVQVLGEDRRLVCTVVALAVDAPQPG